MEDKRIKQTKHSYNPVSTLNSESQEISCPAPPAKPTDYPFPTCRSKHVKKLKPWQKHFGQLDFRNSPDIILSEAPSLVKTLSIGVSLQASAGT